jgi:outer membrane murein-binding lipoprotein Lpp
MDRLKGCYIMQNRNVSVIAAVVIVLAGLGIFGYLSIHGVDTQQFLYGFGVLCAPTLALLWNNFKTNEISKNVDTMSTKVDKIEKQTNGNLTEQLNAIPAKVVEELGGGKNADEHDH